MPNTSNLLESMIWTPDNVRCIVLDAAGRILGQPHAGLPTNVSPALNLYHDLGLNSLQRMELAALINEFFGIFQTSAANYLLAQTGLDHWVECILRARAENDNALTFRTSGTGGQAKAITHTMASLLAEGRFLGRLLGPPGPVISMVPTHHIYGFLYTIVLPALWQQPLQLLADTTRSTLPANALLIGTPFTWEYLSQSLPPGERLPIRGVSSTAPMPPALFIHLLNRGLPLTEIYGSSETGGLAYRHHSDHDFTLFPYWQLQPGQSPGEPPTVSHTNTGQTYAIPDRIEHRLNGTIRVLGRFDEAVQIAGVNVYPAHVRAVIESCPLVAEADVYAKADAGVVQLYGAVRLRTHNEANRAACLRWFGERLSAPEFPKHLYLY